MYRSDSSSAINSSSHVQLLGTCVCVCACVLSHPLMYVCVLPYWVRVCTPPLLYSPIPSPQAKPEDTLDLCKLINDDLAATVSKHPTRFTALGTLPMQAPKLAVQELTRCVKVCVLCMCGCGCGCVGVWVWVWVLL